MSNLSSETGVTMEKAYTLTYQKQFAIAILAGVFALLFAPFGIAVTFGSVRIDMPWSIIFPMIVSMAYGSRYGLIAGIFGAALYPFFLWQNNGFANILNFAVLLFLLFILGAMHFDKADASYSNVLLRLIKAYLLFMPVMAVAVLILFNPILALNSVLANATLLQHIEINLLINFVIKDAVNYFFMAVLSELLLRMRFTRKLLGLPVPHMMCYNDRIVFNSILNMLIIGGILFILDAILFPHQQSNSNNHIYLAILVILWGGIFASRNIVDFVERRVESERALKLSEERFAHISSCADEWIWEIDCTGLYTYSNDVVERVLGYAADDIIGKKYFYDFISGTQKEEGKNNLLSKIDQSQPIRKFTAVKINKSGQEVIVESNGEPIVDRDGVTVGYRGVDRDITESSIAEEQIRQSEEKFRTAFEISPDSLNINRLYDGKYISINSGFTRITGYTSEEVIGRTSVEINIWDNIEDRNVLVAGLLKNGTVENHEAVFVAKNGTKRIGLMSASVIMINGEKHILSMTRDITSRKKAEDELTILSSAVEQSPASIIITDLNGDIEYANPKALQTSGYSLEELLNKNPRIFSSKETPTEIYADMWKTIWSGNEWRGEFHNKKKTGELYWEEASISPIKDVSGKFSHFMAIKEDITEKKAMDKNLLEAKLEAETASKLKDAFIANISHEIRTPLNGILGMSAIIESIFSSQATDEEKLFFSSIDTSSRRLMSTIDMILNFSRLQVGEYPTKRTSFSLANVVATLLNEKLPIAKKKTLDIEFYRKTDIDTVNADEGAVLRALSNILDNAIKFSSKGTIKITLHADTNNTLYLDIVDEGVGISAEYMKHIFEPYTQEVTGFNRPYEGVGLGLSIAKRLLDLNKIAITVNSTKDVGTTVSLCFGSKDAAGSITDKPVFHTSEKTAPRKPHGKKGKLRLLAVEDDYINQLYYKTLAKNKFDIILTESAESALKLLETTSFDVILMDISLKGKMNGLELTKYIRQHTIHKNTPIIAVTGHTFPEDQERAYEYGCSDFLAKPFTQEDLMDKLAGIRTNDK